MNKEQIQNQIIEVQSEINALEAELKTLKAKLAEPEVGALGFKRALEGDRWFYLINDENGGYRAESRNHLFVCDAATEFNQTREGAILLAKKLNAIAKLAIQGRDFKDGEANWCIDSEVTVWNTGLKGVAVQVYFPTEDAALAAWATLTKEEQEAYKA